MKILSVLADITSKQPDTICFIHRDERMTYQELDEWSNDLASKIDTSLSPLIVYGHMSKWMIVGMIAALKAGIGYVPVDVSIPNERVQKIFTSIVPEYVFETTSLGVSTDAELIQPTAVHPSAHYQVSINDEDIAYTIFTSGSTGTPKGVMIQYQSLNEFTEWMLSMYQYETSNYWLNQAPLSFDLSVMAVYPALASGGTLVMIDKDMIKKPVEIETQLTNYPISAWVSTPSFMEMALLLPEFNEEKHNHLSHFYFCGEALKHKTAQLLKSKFKKAHIYNTYGPTEATVAVTSIEITEAILERYSILPVGVPRPGVRLTINENDELHIHGDAVSTGYVNDAQKTASQFYVKDNKRSYRTGDKASFNDGYYFINGRIDYQIKLNGYRMELEEIEQHLTEIDGIQQAVVTPIEKNGKVLYLVATIVTASTDEDTAHIKDVLKERLPDYMIPRKINSVEQIAMTANGKIDRAAIKEALS